MNKVSVIIPCFNCASTVREAVRSCYEQGFLADEFDIVLVDDCSTDTTKTVLDKLATEHTNITLGYHKKNSGGGATRNTAVGLAKSEIIFCLDSDDLLPPHALDAMYKLLIEQNCDGVGFNYSTKFIGTDITNVETVHEFAYAGKKIPVENLLQHDGYCALYSVFMFTKSAFAKAGGYPTNHGFDTQGFAWRFLTAGLTAYVCPNTNYLHRIQYKESYYLREHQQGKVNANFRVVLLEHEKILSPQVIAFIKNFDYRNFTKGLFSEALNISPFFVDNYQSLLGNYKRAVIDASQFGVVNRNSVRGWYYRITNRIALFMKKYVYAK